MSIILEGLNNSDTSSDENNDAGGDDSEQRPSTYIYNIGENSKVTQWFNDER